ncbi:MAG: arylesterase [Gemmatimonadetes bacterium]|jgi:acyl-CoA thioesterase-1|nr:arylesterase [Gemmatimonadota bacterium]
MILAKPARLVTSLLWVAAAAAAWAEDSTRVALFFGDSLTAGFGVGVEKAYPAVLQARIDSLGLDFEVVNAGLSGETTAAGLRRVDWILRRPLAVFVLELGGNDGLRGLPLEQTEKNLLLILKRVREREPEVVLVVAGMQLPPNLGPHYIEQFSAIFPRLADRTGALLIPFLLEGVGTDAKLMLADGIHPTADGHRLVADVVWRHLGPVFGDTTSVASVSASQDLEGRGGVDSAAAGQAGDGGDQRDPDEGDR